MTSPWPSNILMIFPTLHEVRSDYALTRVCGRTIAVMLLRLRTVIVSAFSLTTLEERGVIAEEITRGCQGEQSHPCVLGIPTISFQAKLYSQRKIKVLSSESMFPATIIAWKRDNPNEPLHFLPIEQVKPTAFRIFVGGVLAGPKAAARFLRVTSVTSWDCWQRAAFSQAFVADFNLKV